MKKEDRTGVVDSSASILSSHIRKSCTFVLRVRIASFAVSTRFARVKHQISVNSSYYVTEKYDKLGCLS